MKGKTKMGNKMTIEDALKLYGLGIRFGINDGIVVGCGGVISKKNNMEDVSDGKFRKSFQ